MAAVVVAGACGGPAIRDQRLALLEREAARPLGLRIDTGGSPREIRIPVPTAEVPDRIRRAARAILGEDSPIELAEIWRGGDARGWSAEAALPSGRRWVLLDRGGAVRRRGQELRGDERARVLERIHPDDRGGALLRVTFVEGEDGDGYLLERRLVRVARAFEPLTVETFVPFRNETMMRASRHGVRTPAEVHWELGDELETLAPGN